MRFFIVVLSIVAAFGSRALAQSEGSPSASPTVGSSGTSSVATTTSAPAASLTTGQPGTAQTAPSLRGASVWGILPWGGVGVGARYTIPLPIHPLLSKTSLRDDFSLEFGADVLRWSYGQDTLYTSSYSWTEVLPVVGMAWNLWFNDNFALYPKIEVGYAFGWLSDSAYSGAGYGGAFVSGAGGLLYKLNNALTLRAEAGSSGLKLGAGWLF